MCACIIYANVDITQISNEEQTDQSIVEGYEDRAGVVGHKSAIILHVRRNTHTFVYARFIGMLEREITRAHIIILTHTRAYACALTRGPPP